MNEDRWQKLGFVLFTGEYSAGLIAGTGLGLLLGVLWSDLLPIMAKDALKVVAFGLTTAGVTWARAIQQKKLRQDKAEKESDGSG